MGTTMSILFVETLEKCYKRGESISQNYSYKIIARSKIVQRRAKLLKLYGKIICYTDKTTGFEPIENVFNTAKREMKRQAIRNHITFETFEEFS